MGRRRNKVLGQIVKDCTESGKNTLNKFARAGRSRPLPASRSGVEPLGMASSGATSAPVLIAARPTRGRSEIGEFDRKIVATPPQENLPLFSKGDMTSSGDQRTTPSDVPAIPPSDVLPQSQVSEVDEFLKGAPLPTLNEPTAAILAKVDSAKALKHEGSMLYQVEKGVWVAGLLPKING